jgi:hypothetical protein
VEDEPGDAAAIQSATIRLVVDCQTPNDGGSGADETSNDPDEVIPGPPPPPPTNEPDTQNDAMIVFIEDIAERLVNTELIQLGRRADKACDDRSRFNEWAERFYGNHRARVLRALAPVLRVSGDVSDDVVTSLVTTLTDEPCAELCEGDPTEILERWKKDRVAVVTSSIQELMESE